MRGVVRNTFRSSLVCLTAETGLLIVAEAGALNSASKITVLNTIPLCLYLSLPRHVLQIRTVAQTIRLRVVSIHARLSIVVRKVAGPISRISI